MNLEDFVPLDDVVVPVLVPEVGLFLSFGLAGKGAYERGKTVEFIVESVG